jgi:predicted transcriptional regulator
VAAVGRRDHRDAAVAVRRAEVRRRLQHLAQHRHRPRLARHQQRVVAVEVLEVDVRAGGDQRPRDLDVVAKRRRGHRGAA